MPLHLRISSFDFSVPVYKLSERKPKATSGRSESIKEAVLLPKLHERADSNFSLETRQPLKLETPRTARNSQKVYPGALLTDLIE